MGRIWRETEESDRKKQYFGFGISVSANLKLINNVFIKLDKSTIVIPSKRFLQK